MLWCNNETSALQYKKDWYVSFLNYTAKNHLLYNRLQQYCAAPILFTVVNNIEPALLFTLTMLNNIVNNCEQ